MCVVARELRKILMLGKIEGKRRSRQQNEMVGWHHRLNDMRLSKLQEIVKDRKAWYQKPLKTFLRYPTKYLCFT